MADTPNDDVSSITHEDLTLDLNADVAEWCPLAAPHSRLLAAGTYQLDEAAQRRDGQLYLYRLLGDIQSGSKLALEQICTHPLPGIFDLRWLPRGSSPVLAAALSDGSIRLMQPREEEGSAYAIAELASSSGGDNNSTGEGAMALSVDCSNDAQSLISSYSDGSIAMHQVTPAGLICVRSWQGHDLEAWTASHDAWSPDLSFSGGDDSAFKGWDLRQPPDAPAALWVDRRSHGAGVCCIVSSPFQQHIVCSGSYDEGARLWDIRMGARPVKVAEFQAGGGVWRLKWHPTDQQLLLAACMHGGFAILKADGGGNGSSGIIEVVERYPWQQTLAYGAGWCSEVGGDGTSVAATASFYDRLLHLWSPGTKASIS